jgi:L-threonylcarbamoyladenylate synthase
VDIDARAERLAAVFWPGPLTLVLPRRADATGLAPIAPEVSAGQPTVALRAPSHPVARALLAAFGGPIAAPSANRSLAVSPTTAAHVLEELDGRVALILDGGATEIGLESTVLDLSVPVPAILRPGMVLRSQIEAALGSPIRVGSDPAAAGGLRSPGLLERHYAPQTPLLIKSRAELVNAPGEVAVISVGPLEGARVWSLESNAEGYARELYAALRAADRSGSREIWAEQPPEGEAWSAIHDRLRRAAHRLG